MRRLALAVSLICCGGKPMPATLSDGCYNVGSAFCERASACDTLRGTTGQCRTDFVVGCCAGVDCSRPVAQCKDGITSCCASSKCDVIAVDVGVFDRCEAGVRQLTCGQLAAGLVPVGCLKDGGS